MVWPFNVTFLHFLIWEDFKSNLLMYRNKRKLRWHNQRELLIMVPRTFCTLGHLFLQELLGIACFFAWKNSKFSGKNFTQGIWDFSRFGLSIKRKVDPPPSKLDIRNLGFGMARNHFERCLVCKVQFFLESKSKSFMTKEVNDGWFGNTEQFVANVQEWCLWGQLPVTKHVKIYQYAICQLKMQNVPQMCKKYWSGAATKSLRIWPREILGRSGEEGRRQRRQEGAPREIYNFPTKNSTFILHHKTAKTVLVLLS